MTTDPRTAAVRDGALAGHAATLNECAGIKEDKK